MKTGVLLSMALAALVAVPGVARADWGWSFGWGGGGWGPPVYRPAPPAYFPPPPPPVYYRPPPPRQVCRTVWERQSYWSYGVRYVRSVPVSRCRWVGPRGW